MALLNEEKPACPSLAGYATEWLKNVEDEQKPSTAGFYGQFLRLYVLPKFGESRLNEIGREDVKRFIAELRGRGLAKNTIRLAVTTLRAALNAAVEDGLVEQNPAQGFGRFVKSEKATREATSLKPKEVERLLEAAKAQLSLADYALIFTAVRAGLREGEIAALQLGDIQFETARRIRTVTLLCGGITIGAVAQNAHSEEQEAATGGHKPAAPTYPVTTPG